MFKATLENITNFRDALTSVSELITEAVFKVKKDGIYMTAADPTMVALVSFKYLSSEFSSYDVDKDEDVSVNLENMLSILKRASPSDKVSFELDKDGNKLNITFSGKSTRRFVLPLINIDDNEAPEMNLEFSATIDIHTSILEDGIGDASIISDTLTLCVENEVFIISSKGDLNKVKLEIDKKSEGLLDLKSDGNSRSNFSLEYFKKIIKSSKLSDVVKIEMGSDYPARITFRQKDRFEINYVLAPRVED